MANDTTVIEGGAASSAPLGGAVPPTKRRTNRAGGRKGYRPNPETAGLWFILPALLLLLALIMYPLLNGFYVSLFNTNLLGRWDFVGLRYYADTFTNPDVWRSLGITFGYTACVVIGNMVIGTFLAVLLNRALRGRTWFRAILIIPWLFPEVVVALIFKWILNPVYGPLNEMLRMVGYSGPTIDWLGTPDGAFASIVFASIWKGYPLVMVMVLAGLQTIPDELYEAASLDGAGKLRSFWSITLPALKPVMLILVILETVWYFKQFTIPWVMTAGGPVGATNIISLQIYQTAFQNFQFGRGAAIAVLVFGIVLVLTFIYRKVIRDDSDR